MKLIHPLEGFTHFGYEFLDNYGRGWHPGLDYNKGSAWADLGAPIRAVADGEVVFSQNTSDWGWLVVIWHPEFKRWSRTGHMRKVFVSVGANVKQGDTIGELGNEGNSSAPHDHHDWIKKELPGGWTSYVNGWSKDKVKKYYEDFRVALKDSQNIDNNEMIIGGVKKAISGAWEVLEGLPNQTDDINEAQALLHEAQKKL